MRRTVKITAGCLAFLCGLGIAGVGVELWEGLVVCALGLAALACTRSELAIVAAVCAGLVLGIWRGGIAHDELLAAQTFVGQKVVAQGEVMTDPTFDDKGQLDLRLQNVWVNEQKINGTVRVKSFTHLGVKRGDVVRAAGKLQPGFGNYQAAIYFAELSVVSQNNSFFETLRRQFAAVIYTNIPDPQASLGLGFLLGLKAGLPDNLDEQLKILGLTHIVVASGYNLTILVRLAKRLFEKVSKYQTLVASGGLIAMFLIVTGFSPSMGRAALVSGFSVWAWYYGRRIHPFVLVAVVAAITAGLNPLFLWSDIGWWLSFLAFIGVLVLAPLLQRRMLGEREPKLIVQVIFETIAAQLLTLPLILWIFGEFSVLALVANVLIVPFVPLAMLATFVAGIVGFFAPTFISALVAWPATLVLSFMTQVTSLLAAVPWAQVPVPISASGMLGCYAMITGIIFVLWHRVGPRFLARSAIE